MDNKYSTLLVLNCSDKSRKSSRLVKQIKSKFFRWEITTAFPGNISLFINEINNAIKNNYKTIIVGGGDGSVSLAASLLAGSKTSLMILPMGTVNALARSVNIPLNPAESVEYYDENRVCSIDTGEINNRFFLCFMSIGVDARAVHIVDTGLKKYTGKYAYAVSGIKTLLQYKYINPFFVDNKKYYNLIVSNLPNYAGFNMFPGNDLKDGIINFSAHNSNNILKTLKWFFTNPKPVFRAVKEIEIEYKQSLYIQLDGEPVPFEKFDTPAKKLIIKVHPGNLNIFF